MLYSTSMVLLGVVLFFLIVLLIFCIIYYIKASRTTSLIKHAACGQLLPRRVSLFVIVINFILMAFCILRGHDQPVYPLLFVNASALY